MARICEELKNLMEAFDVGEGHEEPLASTDVKTRLRHALIEAASEFDDESADVKSVEAVLQSTIERVTGMPWYEATKSKIVWDLLEHHSISHTIDDILDNLITVEDESEKVEEKFEGSLTQKEAAELALRAKKEDPSAYAVLYGVRYPNERRAHFFDPVYIEDENEMRQRVGSATMVYALYNKKDPFKESKEDANALMMKIEKLYNRYHDYIDGEYTAHNEVESDKIIDELHDLLVENGLRDEEIGCIIDAMDIDYRKDFVPVVLKCLHSMKEDVVKQGSYWVNKGKEGTHGKFKTKKEAEAQTRAMYARGFRESWVDNAKVIDRKDLPKLGDKKYDSVVTEVKKIDEKDGYEIYRVSYTEEGSIGLSDDDFTIDTAHWEFAVPKNRIEEKVSPKDFNPTITGKAYKVFRVKNGKLYPPMVANAGNEATPVGVWLDAEEGEFAGLSKTGRMKVKSSGGGTLAYRPGWHLGDLPLAKQFYRTNKETGEKEFPKDFVWAECDYVADIDYQDEAMSYGYTPSGKFQHSLAGLPKLPKGGYYRYRTNPNPDTVPWIITGAMKVNRLLDDKEVANILASHGIEAPKREGGEKTLADLGLKQVGE